VFSSFGPKRTESEPLTSALAFQLEPPPLELPVPVLPVMSSDSLADEPPTPNSCSSRGAVTD